VDGHVTRNIGTQDIRLVRDYIPGQIERTSERKLWIYQYRNQTEQPWNSFYAFSDMVEFLPSDFHIMNWYTGSHPESFQTFTVLIVKFLRRPCASNPDEREIYGKRMLVKGTVKENLGGKTKVVYECHAEKDRIKALKAWFDIELTDEEQKSIRGWTTDLGP
jgi:arylamine N-acetyltransferase